MLKKCPILPFQNDFFEKNNTFIYSLSSSSQMLQFMINQVTKQDNSNAEMELIFQ